MNTRIKDIMSKSKCSQATAYRQFQRERREKISDNNENKSDKSSVKREKMSDNEKIITPKDENSEKIITTSDNKCKCCNKPVGKLICICIDCVSAGKKHNDYLKSNKALKGIGVSFGGAMVKV